LSRVKLFGKKLGSPLIISERGLNDADNAHRKGIKVITA
jgi:hypothetical protein